MYTYGLVQGSRKARVNVAGPTVALDPSPGASPKDSQVLKVSSTCHRKNIATLLVSRMPVTLDTTAV